MTAMHKFAFRDDTRAVDDLALVEQYAQLFMNGARSPVLRRPSEVGLEYRDVFFTASDGVPLEAWFIPARSDKLLIVNHPLSCNRYGFAGHLSPWDTMFGGSEVSFLPELKHLHDAGYNILTYDMRNHGLSGAAHGGIGALGLLECRDVVGAIRYANSRRDLASMTVGLYGRGMGGNAIVVAMSKCPEEFAEVRAVALLDVACAKTYIERAARRFGVDLDWAARQLDERLHVRTGFRLDELTPVPYARRLRVPTLMAQLRGDSPFDVESDARAVFDALGAQRKEQLWIEPGDPGSHAWDHFGLHPERLTEWFDRTMVAPQKKHPWERASFA